MKYYLSASYLALKLVVDIDVPELPIRSAVRYYFYTPRSTVSLLDSEINKVDWSMVSVFFFMSVYTISTKRITSINIIAITKYF